MNTVEQQSRHCLLLHDKTISGPGLEITMVWSVRTDNLATGRQDVHCSPCRTALSPGPSFYTVRYRVQGRTVAVQPRCRAFSLQNIMARAGVKRNRLFTREPEFQAATSLLTELLAAFQDEAPSRGAQQPVQI